MNFKTKNSSQYSIVIPAYNEDSSIKKLINQIVKISDIQIIIIDDGSDNPITLDKPNLDIIRNSKNRGKGYSIIKGIRASIKKGAKYSIVMDADLQHSPNNIKSFIDQGLFDIVLGFRKFQKPMPIQRILSNKITSFIVSKIIKKNIKDVQSGYRCYKNSIIKNYNFKETGFHFESEIILKLGSKINIKQIPIDTIYNDSKSSIKTFRDIFLFIKLILRYIISVG